MLKPSGHRSLPQRFRRRIATLAYAVKRQPLFKVSMLILTVVLLGAILALIIEGTRNSDFGSIGETVWWAIVTMTTVGYGDKVPMTGGGRLLGVVVMFSGVAVISLFTAAISSMLVTRRLREAKGLQQLKSRNHILICGWYPHVEEILERLRDIVAEQGRAVVLVNKLDEGTAENVLVKYRDLDLKFVRGDYTDETVLRRANVEDAYAAILVPDVSDESGRTSDERTVLATLTIKAIQPKVKVFAHILDAQTEPHLQRANVDRVVISDRHSGFFMAAHVISPGIPELLDGLLAGGLGQRLARVAVPTSYVGKTYADLAQHLRNTNGGILLGFVTEEEGVKLDDILSGDYSSIDDFIRRKLEESGRGLRQRPKVQVNLNPPDSYIIQPKDVGVIIESVQTL